MMKLDYRAKWLLLNLYENADSDMVEMRKAILRELMEELDTSVYQLRQETNNG